MQAAHADRQNIGQERQDVRGKLLRARTASRQPNASPLLGRYVELLQTKQGKLDERYEAAGKRFDAACARVSNPHANILRPPTGRQPAPAHQAAQSAPQRAARTPQRTAQRAEASPAAASRPGLFRRLTNRLFNRTR